MSTDWSDFDATGVLLIAGIFLCIIFFAGTPDIADAIIYWLTEGALK
jgi:hypothetical protein|tara:strand:- start:26 stop:166 length:141 start_codon:yes stop_codon:yes gene_type:complete